MKRKVVAVTWEDAASTYRWEDRADIENGGLAPCICVTVGVLVRRDKRAITVTASLNDQGHFNSTWRIPAGMIRSVRVLGTVEDPA